MIKYLQGFGKRYQTFFKSRKILFLSPPARSAPRGVIWNINKNGKNPDIFETIKDFLKNFFDTYLRFSSEYFRKKNFFFRATSGPGQRFPKDTLIRGKKIKKNLR